jgi:hypothetical protein
MDTRIIELLEEIQSELSTAKAPKKGKEIYKNWSSVATRMAKDVRDSAIELHDGALTKDVDHTLGSIEEILGAMRKILFSMFRSGSARASKYVDKLIDEIDLIAYGD